MPDSDQNVVVCALDFSEGSEAALIQAADFAERIHGRLHLIHSSSAFRSNYGHMDTGVSLEKTLAERVRQFAIDVLGGPDAFDVIGPEIVARQGEYAGDAIREYAEEVNARYIVVGTHGKRGIRRFLVGSVAENVVRNARCAVLTVPNTTARTHAGPDAPILVPVDFSDHARKALARAKEIGRVFSAPVQLIHVLDDGVIPGFYLAGGLIPVHDVPTLHDYADDHLRQFDAEVGGAGATGYHVCGGRAHREIPRYAAEIGAGLIVMATHGLTGIEHAVVGSVTERTLRYAECPVLSVVVRDE